MRRYSFLRLIFIKLPCMYKSFSMASVRVLFLGRCARTRNFQVAQCPYCIINLSPHSVSSLNGTFLVSRNIRATNRGESECRTSRVLIARSSSFRECHSVFGTAHLSPENDIGSTCVADTCKQVCLEYVSIIHRAPWDTRSRWISCYATDNPSFERNSISRRYRPTRW